MLSQSNIDKLVLTGLYGHEVPERKGALDDPRWCRNWTFTVHVRDNSTACMVDTYFGNRSIELTDENFDEFTFLFDFAKVTKTSREIWQEYDESKKFWAPTDSGGMYCGGSYFILKGAKPSRVLKREILLEEIRSAEVHLGYKRNELARLAEDAMGGFYE
jgi:hypothetical protein